MPDQLVVIGGHGHGPAIAEQNIVHRWRIRLGWDVLPGDGAHAPVPFFYPWFGSETRYCRVECARIPFAKTDVTDELCEFFLVQIPQCCERKWLPFAVDSSLTADIAA
jgi:hypothetical protein